MVSAPSSCEAFWLGFPTAVLLLRGEGRSATAAYCGSLWDAQKSQAPHLHHLHCARAFEATQKAEHFLISESPGMPLTHDAIFRVRFGSYAAWVVWT